MLRHSSIVPQLHPEVHELLVTERLGRTAEEGGKVELNLRSKNFALEDLGEASIEGVILSSSTLVDGPSGRPLGLTRLLSAQRTILASVSGMRILSTMR